MSADSALQFPCEFPIKAVGAASDDFPLLVLELVRPHAPEVDAARLRLAHSKGGRYLSVTVSVNATSQQQLDDIYRALSAHPRVVMAL